MKVASSVVVLHRVDPATAYQSMYTIICPHISAGHLRDEDLDVLIKVFGKFNGLDLMVDKLENSFLVLNPADADGSKHKRDTQVAVHKILVARLLESLPKQYAMNAVLQELISAQFNAFVATIKRDYENTGLGILYPDQMSSLVLGQLVHRAYLSKQFGEGL